ncbi:hypothetical protein CLV63_10318 [Murinocardiopsis flavida]|uniref:Uncharacterized protein n=1 Tax=Murinocardiopsis flavida TaxID=645275 RepID=A0A2P8DPZ4_9ACTN|nr:hypothetical protein [Murinocardiopsis flavida]PSK99297.1 hypothetical protein CLV63_10318 [Murinocardiopsis flavida]
MTSPEPRPMAREISAFLAALRHRSECRTIGSAPSGDSALMAWKSSLLDRIAEQTRDTETRAVADNAQARLDSLRTQERTGGES